MFESTKAYQRLRGQRSAEGAGVLRGHTRPAGIRGGDLLTLAGGRDTLVYPKPGFVPATYTILNFPVDDIEAAVDALAQRGVRLERYDGTDQDEKGISRRRRPAHRLVHRSRRQHPVRHRGGLALESCSMSVSLDGVRRAERRGRSLHSVDSPRRRARRRPCDGGVDDTTAEARTGRLPS